MMSRLFFGLVLLFINQSVVAGGSCVVAKHLGHSLAIDWVVGEGETAAGATEKAKQRLLQKGFQGKYRDVHPQAATDLLHAHLVIVKTDYTTLIGKKRTSYGCGFSARSADEARQAAMHNLQNYSWGWKPELGHQVLEEIKY